MQILSGSLQVAMTEQNLVVRRSVPRLLASVSPNYDAECVGEDLRELGIGPGEYTVLAPEGFAHSDLLGRWQKVSISRC
jgi:hypothetical protein